MRLFQNIFLSIILLSIASISAAAATNIPCVPGTTNTLTFVLTNHTKHTLTYKSFTPSGHSTLSNVPKKIVKPGQQDTITIATTTRSLLAGKINFISDSKAKTPVSIALTDAVGDFDQQPTIATSDQAFRLTHIIQQGACLVKPTTLTFALMRVDINNHVSS